MTWLVTFKPDTPDESTEVIEDHDFDDFVHWIADNHEDFKDGWSIHFRKAGYLTTKPERPKLRLILGGRYPN